MDTVVNSSAGQHKEEWHTRKTRYVEHLSLVDEETLLVSLSGSCGASVPRPSEVLQPAIDYAGKGYPVSQLE